MRLPFSGKFPVNQKFNDACCRTSYARFGLRGHDGIDYGLPCGTPVVAAHAGTIFAGYDKGGFGNYILVQTPHLETIYGHLQSFAVRSGQRVKEGQLIAHSNSTGNSTGCHLHFGVMPLPRNNRNGFAGFVDPAPYLVPTPKRFQLRRLTVTSAIGANIRKSPSTLAIVTKRVPKGARLLARGAVHAQLVNGTSMWYRVNGGWISGSVIK